MLRRKLRFFLLLSFFALPSTLLAQWHVSLADSVYSYAPGDSFTVQVRISGSESEIDAIGFDLQFPDELLEYGSSNFTGTLIENWSVTDVSFLSSDIIRVAGFSLVNPLSPPVDGILFNIVFKVRDSASSDGFFYFPKFTDDLQNATFDTSRFETIIFAAPEIISFPDSMAYEDSLYTYQVEAYDANSEDILVYSLPVKPLWISIDETSGLISGTPTNNDVGDTTITIVVDDGTGRSSSQTYTLHVLNTNDLPYITSEPDTVVNEDETYFYQVIAEDDDLGDELNFLLEISPGWLVIDPITGLIQGTPLNANVGDTLLTVLVSDLAGGVVRQTFNLHILNVNDAPQIISSPDTIATENILYTYQMETLEPDKNDILTYVLDSGPSWLLLDSETGMVSGLPTNSNVGDTVVSIRVSDIAGAEDSQTYPLHVLNVNNPPEIVSLPDTIAHEDSEYRYQVRVVDPDEREILQFGFNYTPSWLTIDPDSGLMTGTPLQEDVGDTVLQILVQDLRGAADLQSFSLHVLNVNDTPIISSFPDTFAVENEFYQYDLIATDSDPGDTLFYSLEIAPEWLSINTGSGIISGRPSYLDLGVSEVKAVVTDLAGATAIQNFRLHIEAQPTPTILIPKSAKRLIIDGELDPIWYNMQENRDYKVQSGRDNVSNWLDAAFSWRGSYDEKYFYVFMSIKDDIILRDPQGERQNDKIEIWIDGDNSKRRGFDGINDYGFIIEYGAAPIVESIKPGGDGLVVDFSDILHGTKLTELGADLELAFPLDLLKMVPQIDKQFGLEIDYIDDDDAGATPPAKLKYFSWKDSSATNPSTFGTAQLDKRVVYPVLGVHQIYTRLIIDGEMDEVWKELPWISNNVIYSGVETLQGGWNDASFTFKIGWDFNNLYFFIQVKDDTLRADSPETPWNDDCIEMWIDGDHSQGKSFDNVNDWGIGWVYDKLKVLSSPFVTGMGKAAGFSFIKQAARRSGDGFFVEMALAMDSLQIVPEIGTMFGLELDYNDDDDGAASDSKIKYFSSVDDSWTNPSSFGTAELIGLPGTAIEKRPVSKPTDFNLEQNYPNPFNPETRIRFFIPESAPVKLVIYNLLGEEVRVLVDRELKSGYHYSIFNANNLSTGIYFYRLEYKGRILYRKLILLK